MNQSTPPLKVIFARALECTTVEEREQFLTEASGGDASLRAEIDALLKAHSKAGSFLDEPAVDRDSVKEAKNAAVAAPEKSVLDLFTPTVKPGSLGRLDHYEILEVIGRGGMGIVLKAFDEKLQRVVAVKAMQPHLAISVNSRQRFKREAQAAAAVRNEHVIDIHAVEESAGLPYLVMEYISGVSLQERLDCGRLDIKEILRIGMQTARGLAAAHAQGLVHRDVKPANILLENGVERVKITDFGLARAVDDTNLTQSGVIAGTPYFMAPEQASGDTVDHRADLFGLGTLLYLMCTGLPPFRADSTMGVLKRVCEDTPHAIRDLNAEVPDWLAALIGRLHAKDPTKRLQSAQQVAQLLENGLAHLQEPTAVPAPAIGAPSRRRRWFAVAAAVVLVPLLLLAAPRLFEWQRGNDLLPPEKKNNGDQALNAITEIRRFADGHTNHIVCLAFSPDGQHAVSGSEDKTIRIWDVETGQCLHVLNGHTDTVVGVAFTKDGQHIFSGSRDRTVRLWVVETQKDLRRFGDEQRTDELRNVAVSLDGQFGLTAEYDKTIRMWNLENGEKVQEFLGHKDRVYSVAFSHMGDLVLSGSQDNTVRLWNAKSGDQLKRFDGHEDLVHGVAFSPDDRLIASAGWDSTVRIWNVESGAELKIPCAAAQISHVVFTPDGRRLLGTQHRVLQMWDVDSGAKVAQIGGIGGWAPLALSRDGRLVLTATADHRVRLLRIAASDDKKTAMARLQLCKNSGN